MEKSAIPTNANETVVANPQVKMNDEARQAGCHNVLFYSFANPSNQFQFLVKNIQTCRIADLYFMQSASPYKSVKRSSFHDIAEHTNCSFADFRSRIT